MMWRSFTSIFFVHNLNQPCKLMRTLLKQQMCSIPSDIFGLIIQWAWQTVINSNPPFCYPGYRSLTPFSCYNGTVKVKSFTDVELTVTGYNLKTTQTLETAMLRPSHRNKSPSLNAKRWNRSKHIPLSAFRSFNLQFYRQNHIRRETSLFDLHRIDTALSLCSGKSSPHPMTLFRVFRLTHPPMETNLALTAFAAAAGKKAPSHGANMPNSSI